MLEDINVIGIIGKGVVGYATGESFRSVGYKVLYHDKYKSSNTLEEVVKTSDVIFICVPTPTASRGGIDLSIVDNVIRNIHTYAKEGQKIVIKSTVVPGTTQQYQDKYQDLIFFVSPESLDADTALYDAQHPEKIVVGYTTKSHKYVHMLPPLFTKFTDRIIVLASTEAEMVKYMANAYFALKVVFANQIYDLCKSAGIDYERVKNAFVLDSRVGKNHFRVFHKGGRGAGGMCLPKDLDALLHFANERNESIELLKTAEKINKKLLEDSGKC